jgi:hypothetical protein
MGGESARVRVSGWRAAALVLTAGVIALCAPRTAAAHHERDERLPDAPARLRVVAPSAHGPWLVRIDNDGDVPIRIAADVRLLRLEVRVPEPKRRGWARAVVCDGPSIFGLEDRFPPGRELVLAPGESWLGRFDPRLLCFGKQAELLRGGALVRPSFGWAPKPRFSRRMERAPFAADTAHEPRRFRPLRRLEGPSMLLGFAAEEPAAPPSGVPQAKAPAAPAAQPTDAARPRDELAARIALTTSSFTDATTAGDIVVSVEAHNVGDRPTLVLLRPRQLSFRIDGPDGVRRCRPSGADHQVPPESFGRLPHTTHQHIHVRLSEVCGAEVFARPGLYRATPTLNIRESGADVGLDAYVGEATTTEPGAPSGTHRASDDHTLVRLRRAPHPFHLEPPRAVRCDSQPAMCEL